MRQSLNTSFARVPGLLRSEDVPTDFNHYLVPGIQGAPTGSRTDHTADDILAAEGNPDPDWGLHLPNASEPTGDLLGIFNQQAVAYLDKP